MSRPLHHFTVDVEEYFQVSALEPYVLRCTWEDLHSRVDTPLRRILQLLAEAKIHGTFFMLGWLAERRPHLVAEILEGGHEIASHGWDHRRLTTLSPAQFRESARSSKAVLEDLSGSPVLGYRAPSFSLVPGTEWALSILAEEGYTYDSSILPARRRGSGYAGATRTVHLRNTPAGPLVEVPLATLELFGRVLPGGGGAYFRLLPYAFVRAAFRQAERRGEPGTFYLHPWELDADQPRLSVGALTRIRHYGGLSRVDRRLERFIQDFRFRPIRDTVAELIVQRGISHLEQTTEARPEYA